MLTTVIRRTPTYGYDESVRQERAVFVLYEAIGFEYRDIAEMLKKKMERILKQMNAPPARYRMEPAPLNRQPALVVRSEDELLAAVCMYLRRGQPADMYIVRNPDKLARLPTLPVRRRQAHSVVSF